VTGEQKICGRAREEQMSMTVERKLARQKKDVSRRRGGGKVRYSGVILSFRVHI
jgi:hypothetical protein